MRGTPTVWVLSDGKAGHEVPASGVAAAMGAAFEVRRVAPRHLFGLLAGVLVAYWQARYARSSKPGPTGPGAF